MTQRMTASELLGAIPAKSRKPRDIEGPIHRAILTHLRARFPGAIVHHSANSIGRSGVSIARQIASNREMGTVKGFPDLICLLPDGQAWLFEVKAPGNSPDKDQRDLHEALRALGHRVAVVRSTGDVDAAISAWVSQGALTDRQLRDSIVRSTPVMGTTGAKRRKQ